MWVRRERVQGEEEDVFGKKDIRGGGGEGESIKRV